MAKQYIMKRIRKGLRYSDKYGSHPGTPWLLFFIVLGFAAGLERGTMLAACGGAGVMITLLIPLYLYGAYERGDS